MNRSVLRTFGWRLVASVCPEGAAAEPGGEIKARRPEVGDLGNE
jgi:hypothetical protein